MASDAQKRAESRYRQSEKCKATKALYDQSKNGKVAHARYDQSEGGKARSARYQQSKKGKAANTRYQQSEKGKIADAHYDQSGKGKAVDARSMTKRKRDLGFMPINSRFLGCAGHHRNEEDVLYIPAELHKSIAHRQSDLRSMKLINNAAFEWLCTQELI